MVGEEAMSILAAAAATGAFVELVEKFAVLPNNLSSRENSDEGDALTGYRRGTLINCPPTVHGYKAEAAMVLEGLSQYLQQNWDCDVMKWSVIWQLAQLQILLVLKKNFWK